MKSKPTVEQQLERYKKRFIITLSCLVAVLAITATYIYLNYDYLAFKHFISGHYIYTDALDNVFKKELNRDVKGDYYAYFDDLVISVVTRRMREENNDRYTYLYTPEYYQSYKQEEKQEAQQSEIKVLDDRTVYMRLTNFSTYTLKFMEGNIEKLKSRSNLVIDLRDNYGGDIEAMADMCSYFLEPGSIIAVDDMRFMEYTYKAKKKPVRLAYDKILILQNANTASASENMLAALNDNLENVTLIGEKTFGKGIGQFTLPLKRGFAVKATILLWNTPKGVNIHGKGIEPEMEYKGDDMLQFALDQIDK